MFCQVGTTFLASTLSDSSGRLKLGVHPQKPAMKAGLHHSVEGARMTCPLVVL